MSTFKARGIVLKEEFSGESDKHITLLLKDFGKLKVYSRGARKQNSKYLAGTQLFAYSDFVLFKKNNFYSTTQIDMIESFFNIRYDYNKLCGATYIAEMTDSASLYEMPSDSVLYLMLKALETLNRKEYEIRLLLTAFNIKLLQILGYAPEMSCCVSCGNVTNEKYFICGEGLVCQDCSETARFKISKTCVYTINHILSSEIKNLFNFRLENEFLTEAFNVSEMLVNSHLETNIKSRKLFNF